MPFDAHELARAVAVEVGDGGRREHVVAVVAAREGEARDELGHTVADGAVAEENRLRRAVVVQVADGKPAAARDGLQGLGAGEGARQGGADGEHALERERHDLEAGVRAHVRQAHAARRAGAVQRREGDGVDAACVADGEDARLRRSAADVARHDKLGAAVAVEVAHQRRDVRDDAAGRGGEEHVAGEAVEDRDPGRVVRDGAAVRDVVVADADLEVAVAVHVAGREPGEAVGGRVGARERQVARPAGREPAQASLEEADLHPRRRLASRHAVHDEDVLHAVVVEVRHHRGRGNRGGGGERLGGDRVGAPPHGGRAEAVDRGAALVHGPVRGRGLDRHAEQDSRRGKAGQGEH
ncbi:MAG TPA: hypothetical protein VFH47_04370 [Candidatus Thermoplasmatota archaeon]|nr:hypothetical protein [Candidatus Thermoplasmatota archaeon]